MTSASRVDIGHNRRRVFVAPSLLWSSDFRYRPRDSGTGQTRLFGRRDYVPFQFSGTGTIYRLVIDSRCLGVCSRLLDSVDGGLRVSVRNDDRR